MYISKKNHILTDAMLATALINLVGAAIAAIIRLFVKRAYENLPDMLDSTVVVVSNFIAVVKMILVSAVFIYSYRKMHKLRNLIPKEEYTELAKMQEELNPKGISSLSIYSTSQLLQVWGFILIGVSFLQEMGGAMYQQPGSGPEAGPNPNDMGGNGGYNPGGDTNGGDDVVDGEFRSM